MVLIPCVFGYGLWLYIVSFTTIRVFRNYSTPLQGVRKQLILNRLKYGLPTFGFAGATIWWFKFFFLQNACTLLYAFISINICPGKNLQVIIFIGNLKTKNFCLNNFLCSFLVQKLFAKIWKFSSKFYFFQIFNFYSITIDEREKFLDKKCSSFNFP